MRFLLATLGSTGDVDPFLALGAALRQAGHRVTLLAHPRHQAGAAHAQLDFAPVPSMVGAPDYSALSANLLETPNPRERLEQLHDFYAKLTPGLCSLLDATIARLLDHDVLVYSSGHSFLKNAARAAQRQCAALVFCPSQLPQPDRTPHNAPALPAWLPGFWRQLRRRRAWRADEAQHDARVNRHLGAVLQAHGLGRCQNSALDPADRALVTVSPALFPPPEPLPKKYGCTGFLRWKPAVAEPSADLARILAVERTGVPVPVLEIDTLQYDFPRLLAAWPRGAPLVVRSDESSAIGDSSRPEIIFVGEVPREPLFTLASVVIHDGGSATTAAALHAGRPQLILPHQDRGDQLYWARATESLGVAKILPRAGWPESLPQALATVLRDASLPRRAVECATLIRAENGAAQAVRELEKLKGV
jgi:UDP:flavonoid glycosyltransferase YjiC (YdhE family)